MKFYYFRTDMEDSLLLFETGLERDQFNIVLSFLKEEDMYIRDKSLSLGMYLFRLRHEYIFTISYSL